jgi:hypothetical protein
MQAMRAEIFRLTEENRECQAQIAALQCRQMAPMHRAADITASSFGVTANLTSTGDVRRMMEDLDAEIFQTSAALSEFDFRGQSARNHGHGSRAVDVELQNRVIPVLGGELVGVLTSASSRATPAILVQIALQTVISAWSYKNLGAWVLERESDQLEGFLTELYAEICHAGEWYTQDLDMRLREIKPENSKDAARWRTITRKQLVGKASTSCMAASLLRQVVDVIILTRSGNGEPLSRKTIEAAFGDRIEAVLRLVLDLNRDIGTRIVTDELEAVFVDPGTTFDSRTMENMWPQDDIGGLRASELAVCTTGLGLRSRTQHHGGGMVFLKPKVLLRSTLGQLMTCS